MGKSVPPEPEGSSSFLDLRRRRTIGCHLQEGPSCLLRSAPASLWYAHSVPGHGDRGGTQTSSLSSLLGVALGPWVRLLPLLSPRQILHKQRSSLTCSIHDPFPARASSGAGNKIHVGLQELDTSARGALYSVTWGPGFYVA